MVLYLMHSYLLLDFLKKMLLWATKLISQLTCELYEYPVVVFTADGRSYEKKQAKLETWGRKNDVAELCVGKIDP